MKEVVFRIIKKWPFYLVCLVVFLLSFSGAWFLSSNDVLAVIIGIPAVGALCSILVKLWQEDSAHRRSVELLNKQQDFVLGTASHMADVAYDKHVEFCEEYMARIQSGFQELLKDGPTRGTLNIGGDLVRIRFKHSAWLTKDIEEKLRPFENALIKIGAQEHMLEHEPVGERRTKVVEEVYKLFELVISDKKSERTEEKTEEIGMTKDEIIEEIRNILGINILTELRRKTAKLALERISG